MWLWARRNKKVTTKNIIFFFSFLLFSLSNKVNSNKVNSPFYYEIHKCMPAQPQPQPPPPPCPPPPAPAVVVQRDASLSMTDSVVVVEKLDMSDSLNGGGEKELEERGH